MNKIFIPLILALMLLVSCGQKFIGYGVLLWSPNEELIPTGATLPVVSESKINNTYTVKKNETKELTEIPKWRIDFFETREEADKRVETVKRYKTIFARNLKDGLLIRENRM